MNTIKNELVPTMVEMMAWITEIFHQGIRRPGYPADYWVENWVKYHFETMGLQNIALESVIIKKWEASEAKLRFWLIDSPKEVFEIPCFPIPYTTPTSGLEAELSMISNKSPISEKIGVHNLNLLKFPVRALNSLSGVDRYYDPMNEFETLEQTAPFDYKMRAILDPAFNNKTAGIIGILSGYPWETDKYYFPYDAIKREFPGVYVSGDSGKIILKLMEKGTVRAKMSYEANISEVNSHNVIGTLPGMSDEWIVIGSHHDGPWNSAVEDASGIALVLAQAQYWSQIPKEDRPFNLMFLLNCAHMAGGKGTITFVEKNKELLKKVIVGIHLEHVARDVKSENGTLIPLDDPTVRWWFISRILPLEKIVHDAIIKEDLKRSILLPPDGFPPGSDRIPTDGYFYHPENVPFISLLAAPPYLIDPADTLDKIHQESFEPLTRAVIRIINALKNYSASKLRSLILNKKERHKLWKKNIKNINLKNKY